MFKGLVAFISSGALLNPVIFLGVFIGLLMGFKLEFEDIVQIYKDYHVYLLALFLSFIYNLVFRRVCKEDGSPNYGAMFGNVLVFAFKFIAASALRVSFIYMFKF